MKIENKKLLIFFTINLLCLRMAFSEGEKTCVEGPDQTCENIEDIDTQKNKIYDEKDDFRTIKFSDNFLDQPIITKENINTSNYNSTEYFDLSINKKILRFVRDNGAITYPQKRFKEKQQGNFLHFMHLAYKKNLPVYFTVDQILYPYIEITKLLNFDLIEFVFYPIYSSFLNNIVDYGLKSNYSRSVVLFYTLSLKFLNYDDINRQLNKKVENIKTFLLNEELCQSVINDIFTRDENDTDYTYNLSLLGHKRSFNKLNFVKINKNFKKGNIISQKITNSLRFFQEFIFDASKELYNIYLVGKLIVESGQEELYLKIKKFTKYLFNEEEDNMNPLEIYHYLNDNYKDLIKEEKEVNALYDKIKDKIKKPKALSFLQYIYFIDEEQAKVFYEEKKKIVNLFSYSTSIEDWVNNKMVNYEKGRLFPSIIEFIEIVCDGKMGRNTLLDRYNATEVSDKMFLFRDGIDMWEELIHAKNLVEQSLEEEKNKWINSYENSFFYLLNTIGHSATEYERNALIKAFNSILGSYVHFKRDILLIKQYSNITYAKMGNIPDIQFENNTNFYNGIKEITQKYKEEFLNIIDCLSDKKKKEKIKEILNYKLNFLFKANDNILHILNNNDKNKNKKIIDKMFYYDRKTYQYEGWYVDLFKNNNNIVEYSLDIYAYNYFIGSPIKQIKFDGAILYEAMNYPDIGIVNLVNEEKKEEGLYLFSSYVGNEYPHRYEEKIDFKGLQDFIASRKY